MKLEKGDSCSSAVLAIALSVHSLFAGIVIGLTPSIAATWVVNFTILAHKWCVALALGVNFALTKTDTKKALIWIIIFAASTPLGIIIGLIAEIGDETVLGILNALAAGTFFYVSMTEVVPNEFDKKKDK